MLPTEFDMWQVYTIMSTDNFAHVGYHQSHVKEWTTMENLTEIEKLQSIGLSDLGVILYG